MNENGKGCLNKKYFIIGGVVAVIAIIITTIALIAGNAWKKPIDKVMKGIKKSDTEIILSAFPDFVADEFEDYLGVEDMKKWGEALEEEYGKNYKISYKVVEKDKIQKDDLKKLEKAINNSDAVDKTVKISAGYRARIKTTVKGKGKSDSETGTWYLYKIDGKWSYLPFSPSEAKQIFE